VLVQQHPDQQRERVAAEQGMASGSRRILAEVEGRAAAPLDRTEAGRRAP
jgi:hypothetical protein